MLTTLVGLCLLAGAWATGAEFKEHTFELREKEGIWDPSGQYRKLVPLTGFVEPIRMKTLDKPLVDLFDQKILKLKKDDGDWDPKIIPLTDFVDTTRWRTIERPLVDQVLFDRKILKVKEDEGVWDPSGQYRKLVPLTGFVEPIRMKTLDKPLVDISEQKILKIKKDDGEWDPKIIPLTDFVDTTRWRTIDRPLVDPVLFDRKILKVKEDEGVWDPSGQYRKLVPLTGFVEPIRMKTLDKPLVDLFDQKILTLKKDEGVWDQKTIPLTDFVDTTRWRTLVDPVPFDRKVLELKKDKEMMDSVPPVLEQKPLPAPIPLGFEEKPMPLPVNHGGPHPITDPMPPALDHKPMVDPIPPAAHEKPLPDTMPHTFEAQPPLDLMPIVSPVFKEPCKTGLEGIVRSPVSAWGDEWDPSGQYRIVSKTSLVPEAPVVRRLWEPKWFDQRVIDAPISLVEPWRSIIVHTLPKEIEGKTIIDTRKVLDEEMRCLNIGDGCTKEVLDRLRVKDPATLILLCQKKGLGCEESKMLTPKIWV